MQRALSILVADGTPKASDVLEVLQRWWEAGVLRRALWVTLDGASDESPAGVWLGETDKEPLRRALGADEYDLFRLLAIHLGDGEAEPGPSSQPRAIEIVQEEIREALAASQKLTRVNVVVPTSDTTGIPRAVLTVHAEANVLVSPEERISHRHSSVKVTEGELAAHAAAAICTLAGLWERTVGGPFDDEDLQTSAGSPQVVVTRSFARILQVHGAIEDVAEELFERRRTEGWVAQAARGAPVVQPARVVDQLLTQYLEQHGSRFSFEELPPAARPRLATLRIWQAIAMMFKFIIHGLRQLPSELISRAGSRARAALSDIAQRATFGSESMVEVSFGGEARPDGGVDATEATLGAATDLLKRVDGAAPTPPAAGDAWRALRRMVFASMDGSSMPEGVEAPMDGATRQVITKPAALAPNPATGCFELDHSKLGGVVLPEPVLQPVRPCDAFQARTLRGALVEARERARRPAESEADDEEGTEEGATGRDESSVSQLDEAIEQLDRWITEREPSLLWQLTARVASHLQTARAALDRSLKRIKDGEASFNEGAFVAAQRKLRRGWGISTVLLGLISYLLYVNYPELGVAVSTAVLAFHVAGSVLTWLVALLVQFIRYQRRMFQLKYEFDRAHAGYLHAIDAASDSARQIVSLASIYDQLRDWGEVIGWMVHRPEGDVPRSKAAHVNLEDLPAPDSVGMATGQVSDKARRRVGALVGREIFGPGWLNDLYSRYLANSMGNLKYLQGMTDEDRDPDPDWDLAEPAPRRHLLKDLASGRPAEGWTSDVVDEVAEQMAGTPPEELLTRIGEDAAQDLDPSEYFLAITPAASDATNEELTSSLWGAGARVENVGRVQRTLLWLPPALDPPDRPGLDLRPTEASSVGLGAPLTLMSVRLDSTGPVRPDDLVVFQRDEAATPVETPSADVEEVW